MTLYYLLAHMVVTENRILSSYVIVIVEFCVSKQSLSQGCVYCSKQNCHKRVVFLLGVITLSTLHVVVIDSDDIC